MTEADAAGEFSEDEPANAGPLLPPEDRLWRHPSEIAAQGSSFVLDATDVRNRWLAREPTRATAWTAGLVGALLATGIVLVGTHLAAFLTKAPIAEQTAANSIVPAPSTDTTVPAATSRGYGIGAVLGASVLRLGGATVSVRAFRGSIESSSLGVLLHPGGVVVAASAALAGASSILVDPPHGGTELVATVVASDPRTGLALLHVNGMPQVPSTILDGSHPMSTSAFALAVTSAGGTTYAPGSVTAVDVAPKVGGTQLVDASLTDLPAGYAPLGSPVLDSAGKLIGMVVGTVGGKAVLSPAWLMNPVADELDELGAVTPGWMGINGATARTAKGRAIPTGVHVLAVTPRSAAARAGIVVGDTITSIDAASVTSITALQGRLYTDRPGDIVEVGVVDHNRKRVLEVTLAGAHG